MTPQRTRRTVLGSIASLTALAGCISPGGPGAGNDIESVGVDGTTLTVRVADGSAISKVNVIAPDDSLAWQRDLAAGASKITIDIGLTYQPGTYRVVGLDDDTTVAETTIEIAPDVVINRVGVGANHLDEMPDDQPFKQDEALVEVQNSGGGPEVIEQLLVLGEVPNPTVDLAKPKNHNSGIYDTDDGYGSLEKPIIPPGSSKVFYTSSKPFASDGSRSCADSGTFKVRLLPTISQSPTEVLYSIAYSGSAESGDCSITIKESD